MWKDMYEYKYGVNDDITIDWTQWLFFEQTSKFCAMTQLEYPAWSGYDPIIDGNASCSAYYYYNLITKGPDRNKPMLKIYKDGGKSDNSSTIEASITFGSDSFKEN